jgi:archaeoflavoprotein AfpA
LKNRIAWGITGSGDEIREILKTMTLFKENNQEVEIRVFMSKSAEQVLNWYRIMDDLKTSFNKIGVESSPNTPFLAGELQANKYDFFVVAPTTSNSTAKIALGIGDTLITNAVNMAVKANVPVYVYPCEVGDGEKVTILPNGGELKLTIRKIDAKYIDLLEKDPGITVLHNITELKQALQRFYQRNLE